MKSFTTLDYIAVVVYLVGISVIGSLFYRRKTTTKEYFLGGRSMSWLAVGISIIASDMSAITVMGTPAWAYDHNLELLLQSFAYPLTAPIIILVFLPFYTRLNLYTAYEYLERRFGLGVRLVASVMFQLLRGAHVAIALYAPSLIVAFVTGLPVWQCVLFAGAFTTLYTTLGGMKTVIWTSVIQFCMTVSGILLIFYIAISHVNGGVATVYKTALQSGRLKLINFSFDPQQLTSIWACIIGGAVLCLAPLATDQAILQRLFTTKSYEDSKQSVILNAIFTVPVSVLLFLTGIGLYVFYRYNPSRLAGLTNVDAVMPFFAVHELPSGVSGLLVASIFAASMGVMSAGINSLTTATTVDIYQRLIRRQATPQHYATVGRIGTVGWGILTTFGALFAKHLGSLVLSYSRVSSYISGPMLGIFLLAALSKRTTAAGALIGAGVGVGAVSVVMFTTQWSFFWQGPIGCVVTLIAGYLVSLLMAPPPMEKIRGYVMGVEDSPAGSPETA